MLPLQHVLCLFWVFCFVGVYPDSSYLDLQHLLQDRHQFLSYPPSRASPVLKRGTEPSADEPAAKRMAFDPDAEPAGAPKDITAHSFSKPTSFEALEETHLKDGVKEIKRH
uniref:Uncharacterized protein n=1 Tax=Oryza brachyantha TaxID=4533 RepID=J3KVG4_ORYBR